MNELKSCPFCGGKAITSAFFDLDDLEYMAFEVNDSESIDGEVTCENERCINGWWLSQKEWNTRPIEDELRKRIAELEVENAELKERVAMLDVTAVFKSLGEMGYIEQTNRLHTRIAELEGEIAKMKKYFHKPAHGTCCTCQKCGHTYDECRCDFDEALDDLDKANARIAELEEDKERLNSCESALISMVNQFFYSKAGENIFRHSFMSAEEEAAEYLVEHGIARWVGKNKSAICFNEVQE